MLIGARGLLLATCVLLASAACAGAAPQATTTPAPSDTATPPPATRTPFPTFTATPALGAGAAIVVGGDLRVRNAPNTSGPVTKTLKDLERVQIDRAVQGEDVLVGQQTWVTSPPAWTRTWYVLTDGSYVYAAFIFVLQPGEVSPLTDGGGREKWVDVNVSTQTATAMVGDTPVYTAAVSTGLPEFPTPLGSQRVEKDGRVAVERMTAAQAGYTAAQATYDVERVLFTQYFDRKGDALHLNYWRPAAVFGKTPTSHGCVGMQLHDAQYFWLFGFPGMRVEIHA
ncbi:MAG: L,D-transpeptidase family protein [Chloroflexi bacterium]|nr:L,D-transpeptidase family protein [Chloroflexota bacterium]